LTFIDNDLNFYKLKKKNTNFKTIAIQNGQRAAIVDIFTQKNFKEKRINNIEYTADYILCFGKSIGNLYSQLIKAEIIPIGSFINNFISFAQEIDSNKILFISQFRLIENQEKVMYFDNENNPVLFDDFYKAESLILPYLSFFCEKNDYILQICGCKMGAEQKQEKAFYDERLKNSSWEYLPRNGKRSSYEHIGRANIIINIDSTLGYEALAQGKKVAFFSIRGSLMNEPSLNFNWPDNENEMYKAFSTNLASDHEYDRILNNLINISESDWENIVLQSRESIMAYDPGNTKFIDLMKKLDNA
jgi:surface carbohydrate biosynthesis protein